MPKDIEQPIEDVKGKKFGVSINNIIYCHFSFYRHCLVGIVLLAVLIRWKK